MQIKEIMDGITPLWGCCSFDKIKAELIECRAKSRLPQKARSVIVACFPYLLSEEKYANSNLSKYAVVADYHNVAIMRLEAAIEKLRMIYPEHEFAAFADNSPIPEVRAACLAGLGVRGLNSLLITKKYGSYVFIGEIVTTLELDCDDSDESECTKCGRCIKACPSHALTQSVFRKDRCLSHITQKKGVLTPEEEQLMRECGCVWGCDICQNICSMNKNAAQTEIEEFLSSAVAKAESGCSLENRAYEWRGRKVIERNIAIIKEFSS